MANPPFVSVCIPTYNAGEYFEAALQSALAQDYPEFEVLISDDGSTDGTLQVAEQYQHRYPHIRIVKGPLAGMVANWNHCIAQAKGDWVKYLFQDDLLEPHCLRTMVNACLRHGVDVGLCARRFIIHDDVPSQVEFDFRFKLVRPERMFDKDGLIDPHLLARSIAPHMPQNVLGEPTCYLFHKRITERMGVFDPEFRQAVDYEFMLRIALVKGLAFVSEPLADFRVHGGSESSANTTENEAMLERNIAAVTGDTLLLLHRFRHHPAFALVKETIGTGVLDTYAKHLYYSGCKKMGEGLMNRALAPLRGKYKEMGELRYNILKYARYRKKYKAWYKTRLQ